MRGSAGNAPLDAHGSPSTDTAPSRLRVGLVLGGGGLTGLAFHAGALTALENDLGWDVRTADVIVGTSAGSIVASLLRAGVPPSDLAARAMGLRPLASPPEASEYLAEPPEMPGLGWRQLLRRPRLPHPELVVSIARRPWRFDPVGTAMGLLADGTLASGDYAAELRHVTGPAWPDQPTWICAVRQHDLHRVVFGRDLTPSDHAAAVTASCAVPAYFSPVRVDDTAYIDGGVRSPTNAAVLVGHDLDLAVVLSPMTARNDGGLGLDAAVRRYAGTKLRREVDALERAGVPTVVIEPGEDVVPLLGLDVMSSTRRAEICAAAILDTGATLREPRVRTLVAGLGAPRRRRAPRGRGRQAGTG
jgi:NTE family protein